MFLIGAEKTRINQLLIGMGENYGGKHKQYDNDESLQSLRFKSSQEMTHTIPKLKMQPKYTTETLSEVGAMYTIEENTPQYMEQKEVEVEIVHQLPFNPAFYINGKLII